MPRSLHPVHVGLAVGLVALLSDCVLVELVIGNSEAGFPAAAAAEALDDAGADGFGSLRDEARRV